MGSLALIACLIVIAWGLVRDSRRRTNVSQAIWIPTIMLFILASRPLSQWMANGPGMMGEGGDAEGTLVDQVFYVAVIVSAVVVVMQRGMDWSNFLRANGALTIFYLFLALSVLWSVNMEGSLKRWAKLYGVVCVVAVIFSEKDPLEAVRAVYVRCAWALLPLSFVFIRYYPQLSRFYHNAGDLEITGVSTQKNSLGELIVVCCLFLMWDYMKTKQNGGEGLWKAGALENVILIILGIWLLLISQSQTALVCLLIGFALMRNGRWLSPSINTVVLMSAILSPPLLLFFSEFDTVLAPLVEVLGRDLTFTGRSDIWRAILASNRVDHIVGAGYFSFWGSDGGMEIRELLQSSVHSAHNGYLDIYLDGGWIGVILLFCLICTSGVSLLRRAPWGQYQRLRFAILIVAIIYNLTESTFARMTPMWMTTLFALMDYPKLNSRRLHASQRGYGEASFGALKTIAKSPSR